MTTSEPMSLEPCHAALMDRRRFLAGLSTLLGASAVAGPALAASLNETAGTNAAGLPLRTLGRTGERITLLGLGTAPVGHSMPGAKAGVPVYQAALEAGINYVDTARGYDDAEAYLGELMPRWRDRIFLVTKALPRGDDPREAARAMQQSFEQSLRLLKTDHVDLLHIHNAGQNAPDLTLASGGPLDFVRKMKDKGLTRFIGITGHSRVPHFVKIIETGEVDVLMVVLNFADYHTYRFEEQILPVARQHQCGIIAMKVFGGHSRNFAGYRQAGPAKMPAELLEQSLRYSMGIAGVAGAVVGPYTADEVKQSVTWAKRYQPLSVAEGARLREQGRKLAAAWGLRFGPAA